MPKKIKQLKTIIIKPVKVRPFNLSLEDKAENMRIVLALQNLKVSAGWIFLTQLFKKNKEILADMIISKTEGERVLSEKEVDEARYKHAYLKELMGKPDEFIKKLIPTADQIDNLDPYETEVKQGR